MKQGRIVAFALDAEEGEPDFFPITRSDVAGRIALGFLYLAFAVWVGRHALGLVL